MRGDECQSVGQKSLALTQNSAAVNQLHQLDDLANDSGQVAALGGTEVIHRFGI